MSDIYESRPHEAAKDPHFNPVSALAYLSQEALRGIIDVLRAREHTEADGAEEPAPEALLSDYMQHPENPRQDHAA